MHHGGLRDIDQFVNMKVAPDGGNVRFQSIQGAVLVVLAEREISDNLCGRDRKWSGSPWNPGERFLILLEDSIIGPLCVGAESLL